MKQIACTNQGKYLESLKVEIVVINHFQHVPMQLMNALTCHKTSVGGVIYLRRLNMRFPGVAGDREN